MYIKIIIFSELSFFLHLVLSIILKFLNLKNYFSFLDWPFIYVHKNNQFFGINLFKAEGCTLSCPLFLNFSTYKIISHL